MLCDHSCRSSSSSKAPRAVQDHGGASGFMALSCITHLRSWVLAEIELLLEVYSEHTLLWATDLATALLANTTLPELFSTAAELLPCTSFEKFLLFSIRSYPSESAAALCVLVADHANYQQRSIIHQAPRQF